MTLSAWEQQALDSIQDGLASSDPRLAALLTTFTRLVSDEEMPVREKIRARSRRALCHSSCGRRRRTRNQPRRRTGLVPRRFGLQQTALLVCAGITAALIVMALTLSRGVSHTTCPSIWAVPCVSSAHARNANSSAHKRTDSQTPVPGRPHQAPG